MLGSLFTSISAVLPEFKFHHWASADFKKAAIEVQLNNNLIEQLNNQSVEELILRYTYITPKQIQTVLERDPAIRRVLRGHGIDLGGGIGCVSSALSNFPEVENIICLDISIMAVTVGQRRVLDWDKNAIPEKVVSVVGNFNNLELLNSTLDFAIAWDSLHHSDSLEETLLELHRVLKNNGHVVIVDRAHSDETSTEHLEELLNIEYSKEFKDANFIQSDQIVTRRDNGEHEYRLIDWERCAVRAGFEVTTCICIGPKKSKLNDLSNFFVPFSLGGFDAARVVMVLSKTGDSL
jgi:SAM-dependent methyltransferase